MNTLDTVAYFKSPSDQPKYSDLEQLSAPHLQSFNSIFAFGNQSLMDKALQDMSHVVVFDSADRDANRLELWISSVTVAKPMHSDLLYPAECRERGVSYRAKMQAKLNWRINDGPIVSEVRSLGLLPIMVKSLKCNLHQATPKQLLVHHEDPEEFGGYFISNGIERLIRLLIVPRRNYPMAIVRNSFQNRGNTYTPFGVQIRCVRPDQSSQTVTLHYCSDGQVTLRFSYRKNEYMVPVMLLLRALTGATDLEVYERVTMGDYSNTILIDRVEMLLRSFHRYSIYSQQAALDYLGEKFAVMLDSPDDSLRDQVGLDLLKRIVLVHLKEPQQKFEQLIFMLQKLYSLVAGDYGQDNPDSLQFQELLLPGHLCLMIIKEKLQDWLGTIKLQIQTDLRKQRSMYLSKVFQKTSSSADIGRKLDYFISTGNLISNSGLDLQQVSGYTIVAEKLNFYRYMAHFRSVHRGSFFAELKTTTVRKLLPESWGFVCPVHTPDGSPCGLLNHLSHTCQVIVDYEDVSRVSALVASLGAFQMGHRGPQFSKVKEPSETESANHILKARANELVSIQLDGRIIGWCKASKAKVIADTLRDWKVAGKHDIPLSLEIGHVPPSSKGQYPGLYLFSTPARMVRKCKYLPTGKKDLVGPFEQVYMDIACLNEDVVPGITTHQDFAPTDMLSVVASMTPFSDFNQSPRNMYQCQMGKQSMGTPAQNLFHRTDNKLYRLQSGQTPIVRPKAHNAYGLDSYPNGMNAVVCVISYTGYDMEDASILSKGAFERGYGYGTVIKGEWIDLSQYKRKGESIAHRFGFRKAGTQDPINLPEKKLENALKFLDEDGLPIVGVRLTQGDPYYAYFDEVTEKVHIQAYKGMEDAYVDQVRLLGTDEGVQEFQKVHIKLRIPRPPIIGDKFSSRHGQKGVISQKWPSVDMPFSETGIIPDVIINPHAFPSRMTIGMFVESIAGKAGALHGHAQDATPFQFTEEHVPQEHFGKELLAAGFNYHGNEAMYSGITGQEFKADIYIGVVYYQRLRHMVSDKYQVRTTGPVDMLTQQPIKGRKRAGGIRFGEMERDSLLAHGVSFLLQDRLMNCSDYTQAYICEMCKSILTPMNSETGVTCKSCAGSSMRVIAIPFVFRYLCAELVAMGVKLELKV